MVIMSIGLAGITSLENSYATKRMVSRDFDMSLTHCKATVTTNANSCAIRHEGCWSPWPSTPFKRNYVLFDTGIVDLDDDGEDKSSLECIPIITSNATMGGGTGILP
jgi:hypothetical protein